jgi:amino acid permease
LKQEYFGIIVLAAFSPLAWVREIETFKVGFIFGFAMIIVTVMTIAIFCVGMNTSDPKLSLNKTQTNSSFIFDISKRGLVPVNEDKMWAMIGFAFFMFEGIGTVMPVMSATKNREEFPTILAMTLGFLAFMYIIFAELCYFTFGKNLTRPIIMEMMPAVNPVI